LRTKKEAATTIPTVEANTKGRISCPPAEPVVKVVLVTFAIEVEVINVSADEEVDSREVEKESEVVVDVVFRNRIEEVAELVLVVLNEVYVVLFGLVEERHVELFV